MVLRTLKPIIFFYIPGEESVSLLKELLIEYEQFFKYTWVIQYIREFLEKGKIFFQNFCPLI